MGSRICMNTTCGTATTYEWKKGWPLRSGGCADLCYTCGSAYENFVFCDTFHLEEPGWRECYLCHKRLHCGCIASKSLLELLDYGGVGCSSCSMSSQLHRRDEICNGYGALTANDTQGMRSPKIENMVVGDGTAQRKLTHLCRVMEVNEPNLLVPSQRGDTAVFTKSDSNRSILDIRDMQESVAQPCLSMSLGPAGSSNFVLPFSNGTVDVKEQSKVPHSFQQGQQSRPILPKPPKTLRSETNKCMTPQLRIASPPAAGQGKNHLLPRYRPRITDQELQQLSGDLNSTIVPLFEKVLTASDAGRIGRLVLPKACAEAYFPPIYQSEGVPLRIQDVKGKEWVFQFRFWPNNNSRMYVLEGVTPCIQSMQLQAGDTITFSRLDPGGKLIMGFRKASNSGDLQDVQTSVLPNCTSGESSLSGVTENLRTVSGYSGLFQTVKGSKEHHMNAVSVHLSLAEGGIGWHKSENRGGKTTDGSPQQSVPSMEKKRTRNIGSKNKRLLMHSEEAMELRLTWQEAQDLLRPSPTAKPSMVSIEDHEFEEYDEPPVFGKRTIFTSQPSGGQEQWAQCDDCSKWRKLPIDVLLPPKWTCLDNVWDSMRSSCSAPEEICHKDLENILTVSRDSLKRKIVESHRPGKEHEPSGLDALASAAVLGDDGGDSGEPSVGATTRHPRHRPGCTCIVCIQPPSGKGKHKPTCACNVCMTVKRRFKTLMLRKKRRQSEREAEAAEFAQKNRDDLKVELERNGATKHESSHTKCQSDVAETETSSGQIDLDLNCHPNREHMQPEETGMNMMTLDQAAASLPLENYMKKQQQQQQPNGLVSLSSNHQLLMGRMTD